MKITSVKTSKKNLTIIAILLIVIVAAGLYLKHKNNSPAITSTEDANSEIIRSRKGSANLDDRRELIDAYTSKGDYNTAEQIAKQVASQTQSYQDYLALLNLCSLRNVPDKAACINGLLPGLKKQINSMPFVSAYSAGGLLEKDGRKLDAASFYQRAYTIYDPNTGGENMMSKDQLKAHIEELHA